MTTQQPGQQPGQRLTQEDDRPWPHSQPPSFRYAPLLPRPALNAIHKGHQEYLAHRVRHLYWSLSEEWREMLG